ncbi:hypothetical protein [Klebsiella grimontii]|uniref:hypothetical protein n=1 Tax=Klebsiella grimontii TaxID=2058152 RepID=UPI0012B978A6|nr:hypothetical protein [Klebsiella grimontii]
MSTVVDAGGGVPAAGRCRGKCLLWSTPVTALRQLAAAGGMSTVVDAGGGVPAAGRSRGNVYCSRRR